MMINFSSTKLQNNLLYQLKQNWSDYHFNCLMLTNKIQILNKKFLTKYLNFQETVEKEKQKNPVN